MSEDAVTKEVEHLLAQSIREAQVRITLEIFEGLGLDDAFIDFLAANIGIEWGEAIKEFAKLHSSDLAVLPSDHEEYPPFISRG